MLSAWEDERYCRSQEVVIELLTFKLKTLTSIQQTKHWCRYVSMQDVVDLQELGPGLLQEHTRNLEQDMQKQSEWFAWRLESPASGVSMYFNALTTTWTCPEQRLACLRVAFYNLSFVKLALSLEHRFCLLTYKA